MSWRIVDPIQRARGSRFLVATYEFRRTTSFRTIYQFPVYPNFSGWPRPFPIYSRWAFRAVGVAGTSAPTQAQLESAAGNEMVQMRHWFTRPDPQRPNEIPTAPPSLEFFVGYGPLTASVYGTALTRTFVTFPASEGAAAWVNYVPAPHRMARVNAHTGLSLNISFAPVEVFIDNAFSLISVEPG
jgi:hypothetical protein